MPENFAPQPRFEIGLVMAGAVSAGAYTAGVLDFLLQALDAWQDLKNAQSPLAPPHQVSIKVLSGASAGGMLAGILASLSNRDLQAVRQIPQSGEIENPLYQSWVQRIDLARLLETRDLAASGAPVDSLLDATVLDEIGQAVFSNVGQYKSRPYFDPNLHVLLSLTNLRGVPYSIAFRNEQQLGHELSLHADYMHFMISSEATESGAIRLDPHDRAMPGWQRLMQAALASGAYPVALPPRLLRRKTGDYNQRFGNIPPAWPPALQDPEAEYPFLCVDGGLMDNEPLELARRILDGAQQASSLEGGQASQALILIDPLPGGRQFETDDAPSRQIPQVFLQLLKSLESQARFKPEELRLAMREDEYSRFLIAPARRNAQGNLQQPALASSALAAFGGFLSETFRAHDFQLGRRNAQRFLQKYFALPESHPLFDQWPETLRQQYRIVRDQSDEGLLPVVPLVGEAAAEILPLPWPRLSGEALRALEKPLAARGDALARHALHGAPWGWLGRLLWRFSLRKRATRALMALIRRDLQARGLYLSD